VTKNEKVLSMLIAVLIVVNLILAAALMTQSNSRDLEEALSSCLQDVENKCGGVIGYAVTLERENSRLNAVLKKRCND